MRAIFISLVVLNAVLAAYIVTLPSAPPVVDQAISNKAQVTRLQLLSEVEVERLTESRVAIRADEALLKADSLVQRPLNREISPLPNKTCQVLGPYNTMMDARQARSRATGLALIVDIRRVQVPAKVPVEHWVFIPPQETRQQAVTIFKRLQKQSFDSFLMTRGKNNNAISLGIFRSYDSARRLLRKAIAQGFSAEIQRMEKYQQEYWLELSADLNIDASQKNRIKGMDSQVQWQPMACDNA